MKVKDRSASYLALDARVWDSTVHQFSLSLDVVILTDCPTFGLSGHGFLTAKRGY